MKKDNLLGLDGDLDSSFLHFASPQGDLLRGTSVVHLAHSLSQSALDRSGCAVNHPAITARKSLTKRLFVANFC
jgi:hypothetical protein